MNAATKRSISARKPVNLSISADVVASAKELKLNLSEIAETAAISAIRAARFEEWKRDNAAALKAYRERVKRRGALLDGFRRF